MVTKIQKTDNSNCIYLTKPMLDAAKIKVGDEVQVTMQNGRIIVETTDQAQKRVNLQELLAEIPEEYQPEEIDWGKPVGKEVW